MNILVDHGAYQNVGDIAMLEAVVNRLSGTFPSLHCSITTNQFQSVLWDQPGIRAQAPYTPRPLFKKFLWKVLKNRSRTLDKHLSKFYLSGFSSFPVSPPFYVESHRLSAQDFIDRFDGLLISGGGNLNDIFYRVLFNKTVLIREFSRRNKPVMLTGQQLGPFRSKLYRDALMRQLKKVGFLGLRDPSTSIDLCRNACMDEHRYQLMGDDSLALMPSEPDIVRSVLRENHLEPGRFIAINLRLSTYGINSDRGFRNSVDLIKKIIRRADMPLVLIPISSADHDSDHHAGLQLRHAGVPITALRLSSPSASLIKGILGQAYGALGTSYHFCTFGLSQGVPALCLYEGAYYAQKARSIEQFWHQSGLAIDVSTPSEIVSAILEKWQNESLKRNLMERYLRSKSIWNHLFDQNIRRVFGL